MRTFKFNLIKILGFFLLFTSIFVYKAYATGPYMVSSSPASGTTGVSTTLSQVTVTFDSNITMAGSSGITVKDASGVTVSGTATVSGNTLTIPLSPTAGQLDFNTQYFIDIPINSLYYTPASVTTGSSISTTNGTNSTHYTISFRTSYDSVYPYISSMTPTSLTNVPVDTEFDFTFSENIYSTDTFSNIQIKDMRGNVVPSTVKITDKVLSIKPSSKLDYNSSYSITIPSGSVADRSGNIFSPYWGGSSYYTFTTELDTKTPTLKTATPAADAKDVAINSPITVQFSKNVIQGTNFGSIYLRDQYGNTVPASIVLKDDTLTITPYNNFQYNKKYTFNIPYGCVQDSSGNPFSGDSKNPFTFTTVADKTIPDNYLKVTTSNPLDGAQYFPVDGTITVSFDRTLNTNVTTSSIELKDSKGTIPISAYVSGSMLTIRPSNGLNFAYGGQYTLTINTGAVSDANDSTITLKDSYKITFTTDRTSGKPKLSSVVPQEGSQNVPLSQIFNVYFTDNITGADNFNDIKLVDGDGNTVNSTVSISGNYIVVKPYNLLSDNTNYTLIVPAGSIKDMTTQKLLQSDYKFKYKASAYLSTNLTVTDVSPKNGAYNAAVDGGIVVLFNGNIQSDANNNYISLKSGNNTISITTTINGNKLLITPSSNQNFAYGTTYTLTIPKGAVKDSSGNSLSYDYILTFTTGYDKVTPYVAKAEPADSASNVPLDKKVILQFNTPVSVQNKNNISLKDDKGNNITIDLTQNGNNLEITPSKRLLSGRTYKLNIGALSVADSDGNAIKSDYILSFKTMTTSSTQGSVSEIVSTNPVNGAKYVPVNTKVVITLSEGVLPDKVQDITLKDDKGNKSITATVSGNIITVSLKNNMNLTYNTHYTLSIPSTAIKSQTGEAWKDTYTMDFTTGFPPSHPDIVSASPYYGQDDFPADGQIKITFDGSVKEGKNFSGIVLKDEKGKAVKTISLILGDNLIVKPLSVLSYNAKYTLVIPQAAVTDFGGAPLKYEYDYAFTTADKNVPLSVMYQRNFPQKDAVNVAVDGTYYIAFNKNVLPGTYFDKITLTDGAGNNIPIKYGIGAVDAKGDNAGKSNDMLFIKPDGGVNLSFNLGYRIKIPQGAINDYTGEGLKDDVVINFSTGNQTYLPQVRIAELPNAVKSVKTIDGFKIYFNRYVRKSYSDYAGKIRLTDSKGRDIGILSAASNDMLSVLPTSKFGYGQTYTLTVPANSVMDLWGNPLDKDYTFTCKTGTVSIPLTVKKVSPANGSKNLDINTAIQIKFSRAVQSTKLSKSKITITSSKKVNYDYDMTISNDTVTLKPKKELQCSDKYTVTVNPGGIRDKNGVTIARKTSFYFTTFSQTALKEKIGIILDKIPPFPTNFSVDKNYKFVTITFNEKIKAGSAINQIGITYADGRKVAVTPVIKGNVITINFGNEIYPGITYSFAMPKGAVSDIAGNEYGADLKFDLPVRK